MHLYTLFFSALCIQLASASINEQLVFPMAPATPYTPLTSSKPTLADLLTIEPSASIFYSYAREVEISSRFAQGQGEDLTVLVPTNKAIMALARKPHQGPAPAEPTIEDDSEISEQELDERSKKNVQQWILAHIIPARISLDQFPVTYETLLDSKSVTFSSADMLEGGVRIVRTADALNGVMYVLDGTIKLE